MSSRTILAESLCVREIELEVLENNGTLPAMPAMPARDMGRYGVRLVVVSRQSHQLHRTGEAVVDCFPNHEDATVTIQRDHYYFPVLLKSIVGWGECLKKSLGICLNSPFLMRGPAAGEGSYYLRDSEFGIGWQDRFDGHGIAQEVTYDGTIPIPLLCHALFGV